MICKSLNSHEDVDTVIGRSVPITGLSAVQTAYEVGAAIRWLCPEQNWQIQELAQADQTLAWVPAARAGYAGQ